MVVYVQKNLEKNQLSFYQVDHENTKMLKPVTKDMNQCQSDASCTPRSIKPKKFFCDRYQSEVDNGDERVPNMVDNNHPQVDLTQDVAENDVSENSSDESMSSRLTDKTSPNEGAGSSGTSHGKKQTAFSVEDIMKMPTKSRNVVSPTQSMNNTNPNFQVNHQQWHRDGAFKFQNQWVARNGHGLHNQFPILPFGGQPMMRYPPRIPLNVHQLGFPMHPQPKRKNVDQQTTNTSANKFRKMEVTSMLRTVPGSNHGKSSLKSLQLFRIFPKSFVSFN